MSTRIYFGTNRDPKPPTGEPLEFGHNFSTNGHDDLRFGQAMVEDDGRISELTCLPNAPEEGSKTLLKELKGKMFSQGRPTFVYIHGYNTNWQNAVRSAANLKKAYAHLNPNVFLMSWPSDGLMGPKNIKEYHDDRDDAINSGKAIYRGLMKLRDFLNDDESPACGQKIVLFLHSMGNYVFRSALQAIIADTPPRDGLPKLFNVIISAAADEDNDAFSYQEKWGRIGELCGEMVVYTNKHDTALLGSKLTKHNPDRLGNRGPSKPFDIPGNVSVVDVSKLDPLLDFVGHGYYDTWKEVINDITQVIQGAEPNEVRGRNQIPMQNKYCIG